MASRALRKTSASLAVVLIGGIAPIVAGAAPAFATGCPRVHVAVPAPKWGPVAHGVIAGRMSVQTSHGSVAVHVIDADLTNPAVRANLLSGPVTGRSPILPAAQKVRGAVAAVNGDFFHTTVGGGAVDPNGPMAAGNRVVKGWQISQPALSITGTQANAGFVHMAGTILISTPGLAAAPAIAQAKTDERIRAAQPHVQAAPAKKAAIKKTAAPAKKKPAKKKVAKKKIVVKSPHLGATRDTTQNGVNTKTTIATPAANTHAIELPLNAINDDQSLGAVLYTPEWGGADRSAGWPAGSRELVLRGGKVVDVRLPHHGKPAKGTSELLVSGAAAQALSWVQKGDVVDVYSRMVSDSTGLPVTTAVGGNQMLVDQGRVDNYQCTLDTVAAPRPRVVAGTRAGGTHLMILTADGDERGATGLTLREAAEVAHSLHWDQALNFDGGGSATMVLKQHGKLRQVNKNHEKPARAVADGLVITSW